MIEDVAEQRLAHFTEMLPDEYWRSAEEPRADNRGNPSLSPRKTFKPESCLRLDLNGNDNFDRILV